MAAQFATEAGANQSGVTQPEGIGMTILQLTRTCKQARLSLWKK
jgi:hypothetical protein